MTSSMASWSTSLNCSGIHFTTKASLCMPQCMKVQLSVINFILVATNLRVYLPGIGIARAPSEPKPTHFFQFNPFAKKK